MFYSFQYLGEILLPYSPWKTLPFSFYFFPPFPQEIPAVNLRIWPSFLSLSLFRKGHENMISVGKKNQRERKFKK